MDEKAGIEHLQELLLFSPPHHLIRPCCVSRVGTLFSSLSLSLSLSFSLSPPSPAPSPSIPLSFSLPLFRILYAVCLSLFFPQHWAIGSKTRCKLIIPMTALLPKKSPNLSAKRFHLSGGPGAQSHLLCTCDLSELHVLGAEGGRRLPAAHTSHSPALCFPRGSLSISQLQTFHLAQSRARWGRRSKLASRCKEKLAKEN